MCRRRDPKSAHTPTLGKHIVANKRAVLAMIVNSLDAGTYVLNAPTVMIHAFGFTH